MPRKAAPTRYPPPPRAGFNEAGAVMPRKVRRNFARAPVPGLASMRPGLLCPGRAADAIAAAWRTWASMRPGLLCPGRADQLVLFGRSQRRASMRPGLLCPGREGAAAAGAAAMSGFNEAGAVMPRKVASKLGRTLKSVASMRPGLLCPGRQCRRRAWPAARGGFNEAGAVMPRKAENTHWRVGMPTSLQ